MTSISVIEMQDKKEPSQFQNLVDACMYCHRTQKGVLKPILRIFHNNTFVAINYC